MCPYLLRQFPTTRCTFCPEMILSLQIEFNKSILPSYHQFRLFSQRINQYGYSALNECSLDFPKFKEERAMLNTTG